MFGNVLSEAVYSGPGGVCVQKELCGESEIERGLMRGRWATHSTNITVFSENIFCLSLALFC